MIFTWYTGLKRWLTRLGILPLSLWVILLIVNLTVLLLPLGSIFFFRIYENQLIRETEAELIAQSVFIGEVYKHEMRQGLEQDSGAYGRLLENRPAKKPGDYYTPLDPRLDLATGPIFPSRPDGLLPSTPPDERGAKVGIALAELLIEAQKTTLAGIRVLDFNGTVIAGRNEIGLSFAHVEEVRQGLKGHYQSAIRQRISDEPPPSIASISRGTGIRIFTAYPIIEHERLWGLVYLSRTPKSVLKHMYAEKSKVILAGLSILTLTLFIVLVTSWTIARPIYRLIERTKKISTGDHEVLQELDVPGTKEMALLTRSFSDTARSLHERSTYIRNFAAHVSHELKTPLTSVRGAAELLDEHFDEMTAQERKRFLGHILEDTDRLKKLVSRLLELAQADSFIPTNDRCDLRAVIKGLVKKIKSPKITLRVGRDERLAINMSDEVVDMILMNLIENARQHGADEVVIELVSKEETVELVISDNGKGISKANAKKIFDPFFTTRREQGGTGIGLGIVKSLLENHRGSIRLVNARRGTCFVLTLPGGEDSDSDEG